MLGESGIGIFSAQEADEPAVRGLKRITGA
jgi:hypothetical protein